ncbi:MAG TPA: DNA polymerase III subunit delta [Xanthomonadales bacterium]|nr:DNA polymerase III subunit delta [Xanthomonadales bacterium]
MNIRLDSLSGALARKLEPLYLLAGAEPLLVQESRDLIIQAARKQGFLERQIYQVDGKFDWQELGMAGMEQSLFASRKIIDLRIPTGKPGTEGSNYFVHYCERPDPDVLLVISCGAWNGVARKSKWASELAKAGGLVEIWPVKPSELPDWITRRMQLAGLKADPEAVRLLAEFVEGNLLAAQQEIDKISLLDSGKTVTVETIRDAVSSSARFDAFRLGECLLLGKAADCLRVAAGLQRTGAAIQALMGALIYQLNQLEGVRSALANGDSENSAFARNRVFGPNQALFRQAMRRIPAKTLSASFNLMKLIDQQSKGQASGDPWLTLDRMLTDLALAGTQAGKAAGRAPHNARTSYR